VTEFELKVLGELSVLKTQMEQLLGIGQPGRLHALESRVEKHERGMQRMRGGMGAFGGLLTAVHVLISLWAKK